MTGPDPGQVTVCGVCARVLERHEQVDNRTGARSLIGWRHVSRQLDQDHPAVPVKASEVAEVHGVCDFCEAPRPGWVVPVRPFAYGIRALEEDGTTRPLEPGVERHDNGDWAACDRCAGYVTRGQWDTLVRYVIRADPASAAQTPEWFAHMEEAMGAYYAVVRAHVTGLPRPADWK